MSNSSAFVSLDKYTKDLTQERVINFYASKKFERIDAMIKHQIDFIDSLDPSTQGLHWLKMVREALQHILDLERPDIAAHIVPAFFEPSKFESSKFLSVADGIQCHLEFEGER